MKIQEIRELGPEELKTEISDTRKSIVELRFQLSMRKLESPARIRKAKKKLAQLLTVESEKAKGVKPAEKKQKAAAAK